MLELKREIAQIRAQEIQKAGKGPLQQKIEDPGIREGRPSVKEG